MSDASKRHLIRALLHAGVLLSLYVLQTMVFSRPQLRFFGVTPLILPLAVIGVGLFEGPTWGGVFGLAAGVLCDVAFSNSTVLFTVLLTGLGMGIGLSSHYLLRRGMPSYLLCSVAALTVISFFQMFTLLVYFGQSPLALLRVAVLQNLYSLLFVLPLYYLSRKLGRRAGPSSNSSRGGGFY